MHTLQRVGAALLVLGMGHAGAAEPGTLVSGADIGRQVVVTDVRSHNGVVSGVLVNRSSVPLREVQLLIENTWFWSDERHPGDDSPSHSDFYTVHGEIAPGASLPFTYKGAAAPERADGHFETTVQVTGFTEVEAPASTRGGQMPPPSQ